MKYAAKKIVWMLLTMVIVSFLAFLAFRIIPGDPTAKLLGEQATPERVEALRQELGLDRPFLERYVSWLGDFVRGDMGSSYNYSMPVSQMLQGKIPVTGLLTLLSFLLIVVLSIPLGLFTARHSGGALDKALTVVNQVLMAVPAFFTGILLTYLFGLLLRWFVPGSFVSPAESFWQSAGYLVFPAAAIAIPRIAMTVKMLRSALLAEMNKDYVRTSYSRGNDRRATLYLHVLRNALPPVVSFLAMTVADIVAGSVVIEQVFAIPGLGRLLLTSISNRDYPVVQAIVVLVAFWVVLVNLLGDLLNQRLDPRLRLTDGAAHICKENFLWKGGRASCCCTRKRITISASALPSRRSSRPWRWWAASGRPMPPRPCPAARNSLHSPCGTCSVRTISAGIFSAGSWWAPAPPSSSAPAP